jgi:uncharacterized OB-fold protein
MSETYNKPLPQITPLDRPFWDAARENRLVVQACPDCGDMRFPPSPICPKCLNAEQTWQPCSGRATLESWVDFHRAYWAGFNDALPYRVCLVRLAEGPLLVSNLMGDSDAAIGAALHVVFDKVTDDITLPKFVMD